MASSSQRMADELVDPQTRRLSSAWIAIAAKTLLKITRFPEEHRRLVSIDHESVNTWASRDGRKDRLPAASRVSSPRTRHRKATSTTSPRMMSSIAHCSGSSRMPAADGSRRGRYEKTAALAVPRPCQKQPTMKGNREHSRDVRVTTELRPRSWRTWEIQPDKDEVGGSSPPRPTQVTAPRLSRQQAPSAD